MYKIFPQSLKHTYFTSALALSIVSSSLLISKSAQAISLSWTKDIDTPTQVVYSATLTNDFTAPWTSFNENNTFTIDNIPKPLSPGPIIPTTALTSATLNMSGNFILNGEVTASGIWGVSGIAEAESWNIAPGGVTNLGGEGIGILGPSGTTDISNVTIAYSYSGTLNSPTEPVVNSSVNLNYSFEPTLGGSASPDSIVANGNGAPTVGFAQAGSSVSVSYNYAAPPAPPVDPRVIPFNYSKTPGLLVLGGIFGLKYALDRVKKKSHHRNLEKSSD